MLHKVPIKDINGLANLLSKGDQKEKEEAKKLHAQVLIAVENKRTNIILDSEVKEEALLLLVVIEAKKYLAELPERH